MIARSPLRTGLLRAGLASLLPVLAGLTVAGCGSSGAPQRPAALAPAIATPLATVRRTSAGTWATVAMGRLGQASNTFWQLFYRPAGSATWSNHVEATAVATNGGIVLASSGASLIAGVRPSDLLTFSPLIATGDGGRTWSPGVLPSGLADRPGALADGAPGGSLALVGASGSEQVLSSAHGISSWSVSTTRAALADTEGGRACGLGAITAVAGSAAAALAGGGCARPGVVGLFEDAGAGWRLDPAPVPAGFASQRIEVLGVERAGSALRAPLYLSGPGGAGLAVAEQAAGAWHTTALLRLSASEQLTSYGPLAHGAFYALVAGASGSQRLAVATGAAGAWEQLPAPPAGTATIAAGPGTALQALAVNETVLSVWDLAAGARAWSRGQVAHVAIEYGSSE